MWYIGVLGYTSVNFLLLATWTPASGPLGCDGVPASQLTYDDCGICGGDGASCSAVIQLVNDVAVLHTITLSQDRLWSFFTADVGPTAVAVRIDVTALSVLSDPDLYVSSMFDSCEVQFHNFFLGMCHSASARQTVYMTGRLQTMALRRLSSAHQTQCTSVCCCILLLPLPL